MTLHQDDVSQPLNLLYANKIKSAPISIRSAIASDTNPSESVTLNRFCPTYPQTFISSHQSNDQVKHNVPSPAHSNGNSCSKDWFLYRSTTQGIWDCSQTVDRCCLGLQSRVSAKCVHVIPTPECRIVYIPWDVEVVGVDVVGLNRARCGGFLDYRNRNITEPHDFLQG